VFWRETSESDSWSVRPAAETRLDHGNVKGHTSQTISRARPWRRAMWQDDDGQPRFSAMEIRQHQARAKHADGWEWSTRNPWVNGQASQKKGRKIAHGGFIFCWRISGVRVACNSPNERAVRAVATSLLHPNRAKLATF